MPDESALVLHVGRTKFMLEGVVESASEPDRNHQPRILLSANFLCTCDGSQMRDSICKHLKAILEMISAEELRTWICEAQAIPPPIAPTEV